MREAIELIKKQVARVPRLIHRGLGELKVCGLMGFPGGSTKWLLGLGDECMWGLLWLSKAVFFQGTRSPFGNILLVKFFSGLGWGAGGNTVQNAEG